MSVLSGGIFSRPRGKTAGIVFGSARTRTGKLVTARELVPPSNPNTAAQQIQRGKFAEALAIVRLLGTSIYQDDWNRAIGQLPGFQSLDSVYLNSLNDAKEVGVIPPVSLGSLHPSSSLALTVGVAAGAVKFTWNIETGINGTSDDVAVLIGVAVNPAGSPLERVVKSLVTAVRADGDAELTGFEDGVEVAGLLYFRGVGTAEGLISPTIFDIGTSQG